MRKTDTFRGFISDVAIYLFDKTSSFIAASLWPTSETDPDPISYFRNDPPAEVSPYLLVGNYYHAGSSDSIQRHDIRHIVSMGYRSIANPFTTRRVKTRVECEVGDDVSELIFPLFGKLTERINNNIQAGETTYVHCHRGRSRSVTITAAYLIRYERMSATAAVKYIKRRRPMACPNPGFLRQLDRWEKLWIGSSTAASSSSSAQRGK